MKKKREDQSQYFIEMNGEKKSRVKWWERSHKTEEDFNFNMKSETTTFNVEFYLKNYEKKTLTGIEWKKILKG